MNRKQDQHDAVICKLDEGLKFEDQPSKPMVFKPASLQDVKDELKKLVRSDNYFDACVVMDFVKNFMQKRFKNDLDILALAFGESGVDLVKLLLREVLILGEIRSVANERQDSYKSNTLWVKHLDVEFTVMVEFDGQAVRKINFLIC